jgi:hypothetical protein
VRVRCSDGEVVPTLELARRLRLDLVLTLLATLDRQAEVPRLLDGIQIARAVALDYGSSLNGG